MIENHHQSYSVAKLSFCAAWLIMLLLSACTTPSTTSTTPILLTPTTVVPIDRFRPEDRARVTIRLQSLDSRDFADGYVETRGSNSIWQYAAINNVSADAACGPPQVYLLSRPPRGDLAPTTLAYALRLDRASIVMVTTYSCMEEAESQANDVKRLRTLFYRVWEAPREIGTLTITAIDNAHIHDTGFDGTIRFTTTSGVKGTLDMRSDQWALQAP